MFLLTFSRETGLEVVNFLNIERIHKGNSHRCLRKGFLLVWEIILRSNIPLNAKSLKT